MKILALSNLYPPDVLGGYELGCAQAVEALRGRGHDVLVLAGVPRVPVVLADPPHVLRRLRLTDEWGSDAAERHPAVVPDLEVSSRLIDAFNVHVLLEALGSFRPDVVFLSNLVGVGGLGLVGSLVHLGVPWVWHLGDYVLNDLCGNRHGVVPGLAAEWSRQVRGHYVAVSRRVVDGIQAQGIALNGVVEVVPYWISGERPEPAGPGEPGAPLRVVCAGRLDRQKGTDRLIEAVGLLRDRGLDDFTLDFYGRAVDRSFDAQVKHLGLERQVRLHGPRPHAELLSLYSTYDVLVFPTRPQEPFGLVALEAASRGCVPLVARDCGVAEWLVHGVDCLKCDPSAPAIAEALAPWVQDRRGLAPVARRAQEVAWREFHLDALLPRFESALARAQADAPAPSSLDPHALAEAYRLARMAELLAHRITREGLAA
ncbi:MAG: glycosyltransferase family 4 protein [Isosphaeraceae bacterium]